MENTRPIGWVRAARKAFLAFPPTVRDRAHSDSAGPLEEGVAEVSERGIELVRGSGDIFRDSGDPDADLKQAKAVIAVRVIAVLDERNLTVRGAARITGFAAADFSRLRNADLGRFTLDRVLRMLGALDKRTRTTIRIEPLPEYQLRAIASGGGAGALGSAGQLQHRARQPNDE